VCGIAQVSRSGYYRWLSHSNEQEKDYGDYLVIKEIFDKGRGKYGAKTIQMKLEKRDVRMNLKKVRRIMKKYGLVATIRRKNPYKAIMKKTQEHRTAPNILNREFDRKEPYQALGTDISYLPYCYRFAYLSIVKGVIAMDYDSDL
jgi:transposase InsO family protein